MEHVRGAPNEHDRSQVITWPCATPCATGHGKHDRTGALEPTGAVWHGQLPVWQGLESTKDVRVVLVQWQNGAVLRYYGACSGNSLPTFRDRQVVLKRRLGITTSRCVMDQFFNRLMAEDWNLAAVLERFLCRRGLSVCVAVDVWHSASYGCSLVFSAPSPRSSD
jgi:hypothetical protein